MKQLPAQQLEQLSKQLRARQQQLRDDIRAELTKADNEGYAELAGRVHDTAEESVADLLVDVELAIIDRHVGELREVEGALQRIKQGGYGFCAACGEQIPFARLSSYPQAAQCIRCQEHTEKTTAQQNRPRL